MSEEKNWGDSKALQELADVLDEADSLLKMPSAIEALSNKGVNASLAMLGVEGLRAYLSGDKSKAIDDLSTFVEEVRSRRVAGKN